MKATLLIAACLAYTLFAARASGGAPAHGKRVVGYFTGWHEAFDVDKLRPELLTHVIYAFAVIKDGEASISNPEHAIGTTQPDEPAGAAGAAGASSGGRFGRLRELKQNHPHLRTLISVGGWGGSAGFSDAALNESSRRKFARSCAAFVSRHGFDGVDIDWEFPVTGGAKADSGRPEDGRNFTLLLGELRQQLDEQGVRDGKHYALTIAAPAGPQNYKHLELDRIHPHLDWINLMTYDFAGPWSRVSAFNAPLFTPDTGVAGVTQLSVDATVRAYLQAGVPAEKIVVGVPFYGRAFGGVKGANRGLFQPHDGQAPPGPGGARQWTYGTIVAHGLDKSDQRHWHEQAKVPWLYDEQGQVMVSYEDPESARAKAKYVREHDLGGVMVWELSQDDDPASLLEALNAGLSGK